MFVSKTNIRVRYGETDQMGYVYYGNYALYYEVGRVEALRELGTSYRELEENGVMLPVMEVQSRYLKAARYDDLLQITTIMDEMPQARITFRYEIHNESGELLHTAKVVLVFVDAQTMRPVRCPDMMRIPLEPFFSK